MTRERAKGAGRGDGGELVSNEMNEMNTVIHYVVYYVVHDKKDQKIHFFKTAEEAATLAWGGGCDRYDFFKAKMLVMPPAEIGELAKTLEEL